MDYFEVAVHKLNSEAGSSNKTPDCNAKYQYQRALALSKNLKDQIYEYSNEQMKHLQAQSVLVYVLRSMDYCYTHPRHVHSQRASETAHSIAELASNSMSTAQQRIHALSDNMLAELQRLQSSTSQFANSIQSSASNTLHNNIPPQLQQTYAELTSNLSNVISELRNTIMEKDLPVQEKVGKMSSQVKDSVAPLLDAVRRRVEALLASGKSKAEETGEKAKETGERAKGKINGNAQSLQNSSPLRKRGNRKGEDGHEHARQEF